VQASAAALVTVGSVVLSFACAVLIEELLLGGLFRLFFAPRPGTGNPAGGQKRGSERLR